MSSRSGTPSAESWSPGSLVGAIDVLKIGYEVKVLKNLKLQDDETTDAVTLLISVAPYAVPWATAMWAASNCKRILKHHGIVDVEVDIKESTLGQVTDPSQEEVPETQPYRSGARWIDKNANPGCDKVVGDGRMSHLTAMMSDVVGSSLTPTTGINGHGSKTLYLRLHEDGQDIHVALTSRRVVMGHDDFGAEYRSPIEDFASFHRYWEAAPLPRREVDVSQMGVEHAKNAKEEFEYWPKLIKDLKKEMENPSSLRCLLYLAGHLESFSSLIDRRIGRAVFAAKMDASKGWMRDYALIKLKRSWHAEPQANRALIKPAEVMRAVRKHAEFNTGLMPNLIGGAVTFITLKDPLTEKEVVDPSDVHAPKVTPNSGLLVSTYGAESGATIGIVNGVKSITRRHFAGQIAQSWEICVIGAERGSKNSEVFFGKPGDAGACVWTLDGRIVGMITSGAMRTDNRQAGFITTYVTPMDSILADLKEAGFDVSLDLPLRTKEKWTSKGTVTLHWNGKEYVERQEDKSGEGDEGQLAPLASE
ncbi:hypothetical protein F5X68DRAFT_277177 [Plectosphaerella plurivora]|uniref:Uncharacterized protein n=1 Tax=Plectosphaerella plurivora TaxID=936078 RepID=A0A9P8V935_9PEZI|nr:hypothetical protein F5X68DRAFT_277177 [Plectosphaerella plurivora]